MEFGNEVGPLFRMNDFLGTVRAKMRPDCDAGNCAYLEFQRKSIRFNDVLENNRCKSVDVVDCDARIP